MAELLGPPGFLICSSEAFELTRAWGVCRLQVRLEALHEGGLLSDDELGSLAANDPECFAPFEDTVADCYEFKAALPQGVATLELIHTNRQATSAFKLVTLSEGIAKDKAFARQAKRKFAWVALELGV